MFRLLAGLLLLALIPRHSLGECRETKLNETEILAAEQAALNCQAESMTALFKLSVGFRELRAFDATMAEVIASANERAFLTCPEVFLSSLATADEQTKYAVASHIGLFEWEQVSCLMQQHANGAHAVLLEKYLKEFLQNRATCHPKSAE